MKLALYVDGKAFCLLCGWEQPYAKEDVKGGVAAHLRSKHKRMLVTPEEGKRDKITFTGPYLPNDILR